MRSSSSELIGQHLYTGGQPDPAAAQNVTRIKLPVPGDVIFAEPLAWYLNRLGDPHHGPLDHRTVLIVDEASTIGSAAFCRS